MTTENTSQVPVKARKPRQSPEQKLEALLAQQRELEERIRKEKAAAKKRADEAAKMQQLRIAKLVVEAGIADLSEQVLVAEFAAIAERHKAK